MDPQNSKLSFNIGKFTFSYAPGFVCHGIVPKDAPHPFRVLFPQNKNVKADFFATSGNSGFC